MRRMLVGSFSLVLIAGASYSAFGQTGVSLGRPQAVIPACAAAAPSPPVRLASFASTSQPILQGQTAGSLQAAQSGSASPPSSFWGSGFAVDAAQPVPGREPASVPPELPQPRPLPSGSTFAAPDVPAEGLPTACGAECCPMGCCGHPLGCLCCIPWERCYASADYLLWWTRGASTPPLVSTGVLGTPGATVLFGGQGALTENPFSGGRFTIGYWVDPERTCAVETTWFFLGQRSTHYNVGSADNPSLVRPFLSANTGGPAGEIVAAPGGPGGSISIAAPNHLWGGEFNVLHALCGDPGCWPGQLSLLAGFRALEFQNQLNISEFSDNAGSLRLSADRFGALNQFYGGQLGLDWTVRAGRWFIDTRAKVALGDSYRSININGDTVLLAPGGAATISNGGLLALPTNSGLFKDSRFGVVPEVGINIGYQVTDNLRLYVGYTFLYWANVFQAGDQVDTVINQAQIPGAVGIVPSGVNRPKPVLHSTGFWAQGVNFGMEYRY